MLVIAKSTRDSERSLGSARGRASHECRIRIACMCAIVLLGAIMTVPEAVAAKSRVFRNCKAVNKVYRSASPRTSRCSGPPTASPAGHSSARSCIRHSRARSTALLLKGARPLSWASGKCPPVLDHVGQDQREREEEQAEDEVAHEAV